MSRTEKELDKRLSEKYGERAFMYNEYPHMRFWSPMGDADFREALEKKISPKINPPLMLYVHIPHCHKQCLFCTCHVKITLNYEEIKRYLHLLYMEIDLFRAFFDRHSLSPNFREIHLGGGSPTYLKEQEFNGLVERLGSLTDISRLDEFSIEIDPRHVKEDKMRYYSGKGINRVSFGIQDFDPDVQEAVDRVQPLYLTTRLLTRELRDLFPKGVNFDIICGLPRQTSKIMRSTMEKVVKMRPDRICLNYMHFSPDSAPHQLQMPSFPVFHEKKLLFLEALDILLASGYIRTGYDHFVLPEDDVGQAMHSKKMHWNRLGVTAGRYEDTIGIGVSGVSVFGADYYFQNFFMNRQNKENDLYDYELALLQGQFPVNRGHKSTRDDKIRSDIIKALRNYFYLEYGEIEMKYDVNFKDYFHEELSLLKEFSSDGIIEFSHAGIRITEIGQQFADRVCCCFDLYARQINFFSWMKKS